jgi:hypothetical protein
MRNRMQHPKVKNPDFLVGFIKVNVKWGETLNQWILNGKFRVVRGSTSLVFNSDSMFRTFLVKHEEMGTTNTLHVLHVSEGKSNSCKILCWVVLSAQQNFNDIRSNFWQCPFSRGRNSKNCLTPTCQDPGNYLWKLLSVDHIHLHEDANFVSSSARGSDPLFLGNAMWW